MQNFHDTEFVIFDVETTGLSPRLGDRIIEIAAVKISGLKPVAQFQSLVDPQREISFGAFLVNGISQEMLRGAPTSEEVLPMFLEFLGHSSLVGHNIGFDVSFLSHELGFFGQTIPEDIVFLDTVRLARKLLPDLGIYRLWAIAQGLGIETVQQHRAMPDVELTLKIFLKLLEIADRRDIYDLSGLSALGRYMPKRFRKLSSVG
jgi:DNA polymerase III subunit alpha, Gram-positive type